MTFARWGAVLWFLGAGCWFVAAALGKTPALDIAVGCMYVAIGAMVAVVYR